MQVASANVKEIAGVVWMCCFKITVMSILVTLVQVNLWLVGYPWFFLHSGFSCTLS